MKPTEKRCVGRCCDNRPGWEWVEDPVTKVREKRRQAPQPGQHGTQGHECQPRLAADGSYLCRGCTRHLTHLIDALPGYADDLERAATHSAASVAGTMRERTRATEDWGRTTGAGKVAQASPDFASQRHRVEALRQLAHDAVWWATHVADERGLRPLAGLDTHDQPRRAVTYAAAYLTRHVQWLADRASADETLDAFKAMTRDAARAMDLPRDQRRFPVGPCPESDCDGAVWAYIGTEKDDSALGCDVSTEHQWTPAQFYRAGVRIKRKMDGVA